MKIHRLAFEGFRRAYRDALLAPGDELAMRRFNAWAKAASRVLGVRITACASGSAHPRWVRVTASIITAAMISHYAVDLARHPGNPTVLSRPQALFSR